MTETTLYNLRNMENGREGAFPAKSESEAKETAADMWAVDKSDVELIEV